MTLKIPIWARVLILAAWQGLKIALLSAGIPPIAISAIEAVLKQLGILGGAVVTHDEVEQRAQAIHKHCSGVACPPDIKD